MADLNDAGARWIERPAHRAWLAAEADALLRFFEGESLDPRGGFHPLDAAGRAMTDVALRQIHETTRMAHCFSIAALQGRPGAADIVDHALDFLWTRHRDAARGGYHWGVGAAGAPPRPEKTAYGHAFVLLAAAGAHLAGHPAARRLFEDVDAVICERFWEDGPGAMRESFAADWTEHPGYRGQNANMHMTEALMAAYEAFGDSRHLRMAERIAALIVDRHARAGGWRLAEHFDAGWRIDRAYDGDPMFRPAGQTPGHALEWARLLVQLYETGGRRLAWAPEAARGLFDHAVAHGWDAARGGLVYTLDWDDRPAVAWRLWWPLCEGVGAAHALAGLDADPRLEHWYRRFWNVIARRFIDRAHGGWHAQIDASGRPAAELFVGKPDIYHALQACLIPLFPVVGSLPALLRADARPVAAP